MTGSERRSLMARARDLSPAVQVGKAGLTPAVVQQIAAVLVNHELIKVRLPKDDADCDALVGQIALAAGCETVGRRGFTAVFFRAGEASTKPDQQ